MIYNPKSNRFVCQRQVHSICLITAKVEVDSVTGKPTIHLCAPGMEPIVVPAADQRSNDNELKDVVLWRDKVNGVDQGDAVAEWLTRYLNKGREYRLMRISSNYSRVTDPEYTPLELRGKSHASYADGFPYLLASQASLDEVNRRLKARNCAEVPMNRFRPNFVISSSNNEPFIEDRIISVSIMQ